MSFCVFLSVSRGQRSRQGAVGPRGDVTVLRPRGGTTGGANAHLCVFTFAESQDSISLPSHARAHRRTYSTYTYVHVHLMHVFLHVLRRKHTHLRVCSCHSCTHTPLIMDMHAHPTGTQSSSYMHTYVGPCAHTHRYSHDKAKLYILRDTHSHTCLHMSTRRGTCPRVDCA